MMHSTFHTRMTVFQDDRVAATTFVTVEEIFTPPNSAYPTTFTMILLFGSIIIIQLADVTKVLSHAYTTVATHLLDLLFSPTKRTNHLPKFVSWNVMSPSLVNLDIVHCFIVAMTAVKYFITTRSSNFTPTPVVLTSVLHAALLQDIVGINDSIW